MTDGGEGVKNCPNLRDVIYELPLKTSKINVIGDFVHSIGNTLSVCTCVEQQPDEEKK